MDFDRLRKKHPYPGGWRLPTVAESAAVRGKLSAEYARSRGLARIKGAAYLFPDTLKEEVFDLSSWFDIKSYEVNVAWPLPVAPDDTSSHARSDRQSPFIEVDGEVYGVPQALYQGVCTRPAFVRTVMKFPDIRRIKRFDNLNYYHVRDFCHARSKLRKYVKRNPIDKVTT